MKNREALICLTLSIALIIGAIVFTALNIATMRDYELNYIKVTATVTKLETEHVNTTDSNHSTSYRLCYTYTFDGTEHEAKDSSVYYMYSLYHLDKMRGKQVEVYVNPKNFGEVTRVDSTDSYSLISLTLFFFGFVLYATGACMFIHKKSNTFIKRQLFVWLPIFIFCFATVFLFWLGLPTCGFGTVYKRIGGAIGYTVFAAVAAIAAGIDWLVQRKKKQKLNNT